MTKLSLWFLLVVTSHGFVPPRLLPKTSRLSSAGHRRSILAPPLFSSSSSFDPDEHDRNNNMNHINGAIQHAANTTVMTTANDQHDININNDPLPSKDDPNAASGTGIVATTFAVMKAILGAGLLSLPSGLAAISDHPQILWAGNALMLGIAVLSAYTFSLYGRLAHAYYPRASNIGDLWQAVFQKPSKIIPLLTFLFCLGCSLTFLLLIGDSVSSMMAAATATTAWWSSRQASILAVTATTLWPLCSLKSLAALAPVSIVGVVGTVFTTLFLGWRCPAVNPASPYGAAVARFGTYHRLATPAPLILIAMSCVALMAHFSAPEFYYSMVGSTPKDVVNGNQRPVETPRPSDAVLDKFHVVTRWSYAAVTLLSVAVMNFGFLTFGSNVQGVVLGNFPSTDWGASLSKAFILTSVIGGFPFPFNACRSAAMQLWSGSDTTTSSRTRIGVFLLAVLTAISMVVKDAGFVVSFNGSMTGTAIIYMFPALLYLKHTASVALRTRKMKLERLLCKFLVGMGAVTSLLGGLTSVLNSYFPHVLGV